MAENKDSRISGSPINLTSVIALLTLLSGFLLVSRKFVSDRPVSSPEQTVNPMADQTVEARLWEDPFKWKREGAQFSIESAFASLQKQVVAHTKDKAARPMLLGVMTQAGAYCEDVETRLRSRFATVSALGESGYVPENSEHMGAAILPWPSIADLRTGWKTNTHSQFWLIPAGTNEHHNSDGLLSCQDRLPLAFEWYRRRTFQAVTNSFHPESVLLIWIDEDRLGDNPNLGLALLLNQLNRTTAASITKEVFGRIVIVGPRASETLRGMIPFTKETREATDLSENNARELKRVLGNVELYCGTPSVMEQVLVKATPQSSEEERVANALTNVGFKAFHSFRVTDLQLATEAFSELRLRNINFASNACQNLALVSEWDTFYGRMQLLTYAAELACEQHVVKSIDDYIALDQAGVSVSPTNLLSFTYLRGLDGQTTKTASIEDPKSESNDQKPTSLADLRQWHPDENKAVGQSQFDYLARLRDAMLERERQLRRANGGRIDAIGILGSDVYDTLLILRALRPRFPEAVFFTTDLDARFCDPTDQSWARNLIVLSGYGLQLAPDIQNRVAPFRDSTQTAQFATTLSALGKLPLQNALPNMARRFEIGRFHAFDISVNNLPSIHSPASCFQGSTTSELRCGAKAALILLLGGIVLVICCRPLQRLTWDSWATETQLLRLQPEDLGGEEGARRFLRVLQASSQPLARSLLEDYSHAALSHRRPENGPPEVNIEKLLFCLNRWVVFGEVSPLVSTKPSNVSDCDWGRFVNAIGWKPVTKPCQRRHSRQHLEMRRFLLEELFRETEDDNNIPNRSQATEVSLLGSDLRETSLRLYRRRLSRRRYFWIGVLALLAVAGGIITLTVFDTLHHPGGEPFTLTEGLSVWPSEGLRLLAIILSIIFIMRTHDAVQSGILRVTRNYRLPLLTNAPCDARRKCPWLLNSDSESFAMVDADFLWRRYQQLSAFGQRLKRLCVPLTAYTLFCASIFWLGQVPHAPVRGIISTLVDGTLLFFSVAAFLVLAFFIMDTVRLCRWLVEQLNESETSYPEACVEHFCAERSIDPGTGLMEDWIDLQLIAELTDHVSRLIYYPFVIFFLLLVARHRFWNHWAWPLDLVLVFALNLILIAASILILQRAAREAKQIGVTRLQSKVEAAERAAAPSPEKYRAEMGEKLLDEIQSLRKGAFVPFWENPIIGAVLVPSGGTAFVELLAYLFSSGN